MWYIGKAPAEYVYRYTYPQIVIPRGGSTIIRDYIIHAYCTKPPYNFAVFSEASHSISHLATQFAYLSGLKSQTCRKRPKLCPDTCLKLRSSGLTGEKTANYSNNNKYGGLVQ